MRKSSGQLRSNFLNLVLVNKMKYSIPMLAILTPHLALADKSGNADLDDIKLYDIVKVEQCLDQAYLF